MLLLGVPDFSEEAVERLPPVQREIVRYMIEAVPSSLTMTARALGEATGTSGANVIRAAQSLGYEKLSYLRLALADYHHASEDEVPTGTAGIVFDGTPANALIAEDIRIAQKGLQKLARSVSDHHFEQAVDILADSGRIVWRGIGPTGFLAEYAALFSQRFGHSSIAMTKLHQGLADELLSLRAGDAIVLFSYGGNKHHNLVIANEARAKEIPLILITDRPEQELSEHASVVIECQRGKRLQFESHAVTMVLIESLFLAVANRHTRRSKKHLRKLAELRSLLTTDRPTGSQTEVGQG